MNTGLIVFEDRILPPASYHDGPVIVEVIAKVEEMLEPDGLFYFVISDIQRHLCLHDLSIGSAKGVLAPVSPDRDSGSPIPLESLSNLMGRPAWSLGVRWVPGLHGVLTLSNPSYDTVSTSGLALRYFTEAPKSTEWRGP